MGYLEKTLDTKIARFPTVSDVGSGDMTSSRTNAAADDDLANVEFETSEDVDVIPTFDSMGLREDLLRGVYSYGFENPSAIQQRAILPAVKGRDVIAQAQSGTGKTATFAISVLERINEHEK